MLSRTRPNKPRTERRGGTGGGCAALAAAKRDCAIQLDIRDAQHGDFHDELVAGCTRSAGAT